MSDEPEPCGTCDPGNYCPGNDPPLSVRYCYSSNHGMCIPFMYLGCGGNSNNYPMVDDCNAACPPLTSESIGKQYYWINNKRES